MPGAGLIQQQSDVSDFLVQRLVAIDRQSSADATNGVFWRDFGHYDQPAA
jgi:hypothetical protein